MNLLMNKENALPPVLDEWKKVEVKPGPYDYYTTYVYLDGNKIVKVIQVSDIKSKECYHEYGVDLLLSDDGTKILPKTEKGKPKPFTTPNIVNQTPIGMDLFYCNSFIHISNVKTEKDYYRSQYEGKRIKTFSDFEQWVINWCKETDSKALAEIEAFSKEPRVHQKYAEGDFFRYRISRSLYGYGRIIINYPQMKKEKIPFWDVFMAKPLCVALYHIATEDKNMTPKQLLKLKTLPAGMVMDNIFYYGECEIIGNIPIEKGEFDYPIHYGQSRSARNPGCTHYQCGKVFVTQKNQKAIYNCFVNCSLGFNLKVELPILKECIEQNSNQPYWDMINPHAANEDLRNPKFQKELIQIKEQMGIH